MIVPTSPSPTLINVKNGEVVHQRILLIYGRAGPTDREFKSTITIEPHVNNFPSTTWPVFNSHFKCLVHLDPGPNEIKFILDQEPYSSLLPPLTTTVIINYIPLLQDPPLHLAIMVAKDSNLVIDAPPEKVNNNEHNLEAAIAKFRCAAYLWQAFTAEQMDRNGFGKRVFRLDEEWQQDTISSQSKAFRHSAKIHIVRSDYTLKEILDPQRAQQYKPPPGEEPSNKESLYDIFSKALKQYGPPFTDPQKSDSGDRQHYVAGLILDSHWDPKMKLIRGHTALGGGSDDIRLGIFGSHATHAWPRFLEEVVSCFQNDTVTDERILANDCNECGTWWRCCNIGIGAMLHEVGHALTCPHSATGIMSRGFNHLNRTFTVQEPNNPQPIKPEDEGGAHWHRCDVIRFRYHPCFRTPRDPIPSRNYDDSSPDFWPSDNAILIYHTGISLIELHVNGRYRSHLEFIDDDLVFSNQNARNNGNRFRLNDEEIKLSVSEIKQLVNWNPNEKISIQVIGRNQSENTLDDLIKFLNEHQLEIPHIGKALKSSVLGNGQGEGFQALFKKFSSTTTITTAIATKFIKGSTDTSSKTPYLNQITIKHGSFIDSIKFHWSDGSTLKAGGNGGHNEYSFTLDKDEKILGLKVRSGWFIDGLMFKTNKKFTGWIGGTGGSMHNLMVPKDHEMIGIFGTRDNLVNGIGIIYHHNNN